MYDALESELNQISTLLDKRLKLSGARADSLMKARRHLPHRMRRAAEELVAAEARIENPRLAVTLDESALLRKARALKVHLDGIDLADRRKGRWMDIGATLGVVILSLIALFVIVLRWRGFV